jgi:cytochrome c oxidase cbb3-type subunit I
LMTIKTHMKTVVESPSLIFTAMGIVGLLLTACIGLVLSLPQAMPYTNFTLARYGYEMMALYGFFSMCMFGAIYFIVPRITSREWVSRRAIKIHFFSSLYGILVVAIFCGLLGGFMQGLTLDSINETSYAIANKAYSYNWTITIGWCFIAVANISFCFHLLSMWLRLGRRSSHPTLLHSHEPHSPHGPDGEIEHLSA